MKVDGGRTCGLPVLANDTRKVAAAPPTIDAFLSHNIIADGYRYNVAQSTQLKRSLAVGAAQNETLSDA